MTKLEGIKAVANFTVGMSTAWLTANIIANNSHAEGNFRKAEKLIGGLAVGSLVADAASIHVERKIDELYEFAKGLREQARLNFAI